MLFGTSIHPYDVPLEEHVDRNATCRGAHDDDDARNAVAIDHGVVGRHHHRLHKQKTRRPIPPVNPRRRQIIAGLIDDYDRILEAPIVVRSRESAPLVVLAVVLTNHRSGYFGTHRRTLDSFAAHVGGSSGSIRC